MKAARATLLAGLIAGTCSAANAWFFFFIPSQGMVDTVTGKGGDHCVSASAKVGDSIRIENETGIVRELYGPSTRCTGPFPIRAKMEMQMPESVRTAEHLACVTPGQRPGDRFNMAGFGEVRILRLTNSADCSGASSGTTIQAVVKSTLPPPTTQPTTLKDVPDVPRVKDIFSKPEPSIADRLRELKKLRDEGLITEEIYSAKQREILSSQ